MFKKKQTKFSKLIQNGFYMTKFYSDSEKGRYSLSFYKMEGDIWIVKSKEGKVVEVKNLSKVKDDLVFCNHFKCEDHQEVYTVRRIQRFDNTGHHLMLEREKIYFNGVTTSTEHYVEPLT